MALQKQGRVQDFEKGGPSSTNKKRGVQEGDQLWPNVKKPTRGESGPPPPPPGSGHAKTTKVLGKRIIIHPIVYDIGLSDNSCASRVLSLSVCVCGGGGGGLRRHLRPSSGRELYRGLQSYNN